MLVKGSRYVFNRRRFRRFIFRFRLVVSLFMVVEVLLGGIELGSEGERVEDFG